MKEPRKPLFSVTASDCEWNRLELMRRLGMIDAIDRQIEYELAHNIKLEIKIDGRWTEVKESMLVDDPNDFKWEAGV